MIRFGILGCGSIARSFCDGASHAKDAEVVAVASKSPERAKALADEKGIRRAYGSYEELLNDPEVDAVYIATTTNYHYENVKQCLAAGKHVLCEKAMVETEARARELFAMAAEKNLFLMEGMWSRFQPKTRKVREWVTGGAIGEVVCMQATIGFGPKRDMTNRFFNPDLGGGAWYDIGVYLADLLPYFVDQDLEDISCDMICADSGVDAVLNINMKLTSCLANGQASLYCRMPETCYIYGTDGMIVIPGIHFGGEAIRYDAQGAEAERFEDPEPYRFCYEINEVTECIASGRLTSETDSPEMTYATSRLYDRFCPVKK